MLFRCERAMEVWKALGCESFVQEARDSDRAGPAALDFLLGASFRSGSPPVGFKELATTACWYLWWERRKIVHEEPVQAPVRSALAIRALASNFVAAVPGNAKLKPQPWSRPLQDWVKLNVDASSDADGLCGTVGAVTRDHHANFVAAINWRLDFVADVEAAEAHTVRVGLEFALLAGCSRISISSDSSAVVDALSAGHQPYGAAAAIYEDCFSLLDDLLQFHIGHCLRDSNKVAHELARVAKYQLYNSWYDSPCLHCIFQPLLPINREIFCCQKKRSLPKGNPLSFDLLQTRATTGKPRAWAHGTWR